MQISQAVPRQFIRTQITRMAERRVGGTPSRFSPLQWISAGIVLLVSLPLVYLVVRAVSAGSAGVDYLLAPRTLQVIWNSLILTAAVVGTSALIGVPFAWLTTRTDLPLRRFWLVAGLLTMVIPSYIGTMAYIAAFGPRGTLQGLLEPLGVQSLPPIYGFFGAWLAITLFTYPYVVLPVRAALLNMDPALEECGRSLGLKRWMIFMRITLPQLRPALVSGMLITALYTLSDFGAVALMRYDAFTRAIYLQYTSSFDRSRAAVLALALVVITVGLLLAERQAGANYRTGTGSQRRARPVSLGRWRIPALIFCAVLVGVGVITPIGVLVSWFMGAVEIQAPMSDLTQPMLNTVGTSALTALVVGLAALPLALLKRSRMNTVLVKLSYIGNVLPGLVVALALVFFAANALPTLYQTLPILILGYSTRFLSLSVGATRSALSQVTPRYEEVARSLGVRPWRIVMRITVPLARAGILAGMAMVFLSAMKELPTTLLLSPTGFETFATEIWTAYNQASHTQIGAPALLLVAVSALSLFFILKSEDLKHRKER